MKRCSISLIIRVMQIKTTMRSHLTPVKMSAIKKPRNLQAGEGAEKKEHSHCWWECKLVEPLRRTVWRFLKKLEIELPCDPAILILGIHTKETRIERNTYTPMFIAALYNSQDMEATQMSIGRQMDKEAVVHIHNGILLGYEKGTHLSQFY